MNYEIVEPAGKCLKRRLQKIDLFSLQWYYFPGQIQQNKHPALEWEST